MECETSINVKHTHKNKIKKIHFIKKIEADENIRRYKEPIIDKYGVLYQKIPFVLKSYVKEKYTKTNLDSL